MGGRHTAASATTAGGGQIPRIDRAGGAAGRLVKDELHVQIQRTVDQQPLDLVLAFGQSALQFQQFRVIAGAYVAVQVQRESAPHTVNSLRCELEHLDILHEALRLRNAALGKALVFCRHVRVVAQPADGLQMGVKPHPGVGEVGPVAPQPHLKLAQQPVLGVGKTFLGQIAALPGIPCRQRWRWRT